MNGNLIHGVFGYKGSPTNNGKLHFAGFGQIQLTLGITRQYGFVDFCKEFENSSFHIVKLAKDDSKC